MTVAPNAALPQPGNSGVDFFGIEAALSRRVVGQEDAIRAVADVIRATHAGLTDPRRPLGSLILLGPSGVGKTELAKTTAAYLYPNDPGAFVRIDMSEYMEQSAVTRFVGAPPGSVGYENGGQLTKAVREHPRCVILLDEFDKAHSRILDILLQVLDDARLTDGTGETVDFSRALIFMTCNYGASDAGKRKGGDPYSEADLATLHVFRTIGAEQTFEQMTRAEFRGRVDECIVLQALTVDQLKEVARRNLALLATRIRGRHPVELVIEENALDVLARHEYDARYGARQVVHAIKRLAHPALVEAILSGEGPRRLRLHATSTETLAIRSEAIVAC
ncbi:MAG: AAA family ATPase [Candidatus Dormibacteria bacterium]